MLQLKKLLQELEENWLANPHGERIHHPKLYRRLDNFWREVLPSPFPRPQTKASLLQKIISVLQEEEKAFLHSPISEVIREKLFLVDCIEQLERASPFHSIKEQENLSEKVKFLQKLATDYLLSPHLTKRTIDLACRAWTVQDAMSKLAGNSTIAQRLKKQLWQACFGKNLTVPLQLGAVLDEQNILLLGETGTGKEIAADVLLASVPGSWVASKKTQEDAWKPGAREKINLAVFPSELVAGQIIGYKAGAYTGAISDFQGVLRRAHKGGAFLDEVGDLPLMAQMALLRSLETKKVLPLGATQEEEASCRIVSATHIDILNESSFRRDLLHRMAGVVIQVPPLRERIEDLPQITEYLVRSWEHSNTGEQLSRLKEWSLSEDVHSYDWPGNIREFRKALALKMLGCEWQPPSSKSSMEQVSSTQRTNPTPPIPLSILEHRANLEELQGWYAQQVLKNADGNKSAAAKRLGVSRDRLRRLLERI